MLGDGSRVAKRPMALHRASARFDAYRCVMDIEYPGFGVIEVEGTRYNHDVVIEAGAVRKRDKGPSRSRGGSGHTPLRGP